MSNLSTFKARLRDRLSISWLTPSEAAIWDQIQRFDAPPHRVINIFGAEGTGKTFLAWVMEREKYASFSIWGGKMIPTLPRLIVDDAPYDKTSSREFRPMVESLGIKQIILLTRARVDERAMPAFELKVDDQDLEAFGANLFRYLHINMPEGSFRNYKSIVDILTR
jgi:hypothetical protein